VNSVNEAGPWAAHPLTGDRVGALYVNPDGTFEVSTVSAGPPYDVTGRQPGNRKMTVP
jgi:hypothetical protein